MRAHPSVFTAEELSSGDLTEVGPVSAETVLTANRSRGPDHPGGQRVSSSLPVKKRTTARQERAPQALESGLLPPRSGPPVRPPSDLRSSAPPW